MADGQVPVIRLRVGKFLTKVSAGNVVLQEPLDAQFTFMPTMLWDLPTFRSRVGVHFLGDFNSVLGASPITGIGLSGYFYPSGVSSIYEVSPDDVTIMKYRPSFYVFGAVTPVNLNGNKDNATNSSRSISFSSTLVEVMLGCGMDYPFRQNLVGFLDLNYRVANSVENETVGGSVTYSGIGVTLGFSTSYF